MTDTMIPLADFISELGITLEVEGGVSPNTLRSKKTVKDDDGWEHYAWTVTLKRPTPFVAAALNELTTDYRTGIGHSKPRDPNWPHDGLIPTPPKLDDILDSLASDASAYENARNFEDFASDFGYDTDSRKAERIYQACGQMAKDLRFFLGREDYERLLWQVERL